MPAYVVIGASRGLGYQFLKTISEQDPSNIVIGTVRTVATAEEKVAVDGLKNVHILQGDMDSHTSLTAAAKKAAELTSGVVDYLIVNGAYFAVSCMLMNADDYVGEEDLFLQEMKQSMETNVAGTLFAFNAFLPLLLKSKIKRVAAITSAAADRDFIFDGEALNGLHYAISKAALNALVAKFAARYKEEGVLFASISPGWVDTRAGMDIPKEFTEEITKSLFTFDKSLKGPIAPAESAEMCLKVIDGIKPERSGEFVSQHGNQVWLNER